MQKDTADRMTFGAYLRRLRVEQRISLRKFCREVGADPGNISKLERGRLPPPRDTKILSRYAAGVGLSEGEDAWYRFFDLAAAETGRLPPDLKERNEVVGMLPAFFRTIRGQKPTEDEMRRLLAKLEEMM